MFVVMSVGSDPLKCHSKCIQQASTDPLCGPDSVTHRYHKCLFSRFTLYTHTHAQSATLLDRRPSQTPHIIRTTMKLIVMLAVLVAAVAAAEKYEPKYDNVSIESVLSNDRVLTNYIKCLLDKGACTKEGRELKRTYHN